MDGRDGRAVVVGDRVAEAVDLLEGRRIGAGDGGPPRDQRATGAVAEFGRGRPGVGDEQEAVDRHALLGDHTGHGVGDGVGLAGARARFECGEPAGQGVVVDVEGTAHAPPPDDFEMAAVSVNAACR